MPQINSPTEPIHSIERQAITPISMRVPDACRFLGIGRSTLYLLIGKGEIEIVKVGTATLVLTSSVHGLIERLRNKSV